MPSSSENFVAIYKNENAIKRQWVHQYIYIQYYNCFVDIFGYCSRQYVRSKPDNIFQRDTNRECVGYATADIVRMLKLTESDPWTEINYKYSWTDIECKMKAPFLCQYNPGKIWAKICTFVIINIIAN